MPPPSHDQLAPGAALALGVHVVLLAALVLGTHWRSPAPATVSAELWAAVPQVAAPPPPPPRPPPQVAPLPRPAPAPPAAAPPAPRAAEIAVERKRQQREQAEARRQQAERERAEQQRRRQAERERAEQRQQAERERAEQQRLEAQRQQQLERLLDQARGDGAVAATGTAARDAAPSAGYAGRIVARVKPNIIFTDSIAGNPAAEVELRMLPDGTIAARRIVQASGVAAWDDAVLRAIDRTAVLPRDIDGRVPPTIVIVFRPRD